MEKHLREHPADDELERRRLQEYLFGLEEVQEEAEQLVIEHEKLRHSTELLIALLRGTIHGICLIRDGRFVWGNKAMGDVLGWNQDELVGQRIDILFGREEEVRKTQDYIQGRLDDTGLFVFEHEFIHKEGHRVPCLATGKALDILDPSKGYVFSFTDITSRKQAEEALQRINDQLEQRVEERTAELIEANNKLVREIEVRKGIEAQLRRGEEALRRHNLYLATLHETTLGLMRRLDPSDLLQTIVSRAAALVGTPDGFVYLYQPETELLELKVGLGLCGDQVGYRIRPGEGIAGKAWREARAMVVNNYQAWNGRSMDGRWDSVAAVAAIPLTIQSRVTGVIGLMHTQDGREFGEEEIDVLGRFGELASVALDNAGLYLSLQQELEERVQTEQALKQSEDKYRSVINQSGDCVFLVDPASKCVIEANPAFQHLLGYAEHEVFGLHVYDLAAHDREDIDAKMRQSVEERRHFIGERQYRKTDGTLVDVEVSANLISYGGKEILCVVSRDITARKKAEKELLKAQKLESLGLLAGGIAHDFNNILTGILGNISLAKLHAKDDTTLIKRLADAEKATMRAKDLTYQLLTFAKGGAPIKETASIEDIVRDTCGFALRGSNVGYDFRPAQDLWPVEIDRGQISQVVGNLVVNAKQAMPEGGTIEITSANVVLNEGRVATLPAGKYVLISVQDHGIGIPQRHLARIFDPYFTTKQGGSGLGLATSYSIIEKHDGHIEVKSEPGSGTIFQVYLPASDGAAPPAPKIETRPIPGKGRILVMDDEEMIREVAKEMLILLGYQVEVAENGAQAVHLYEQALDSGRRFDAVLMDLTVPGGMGGKEAIRKLLELDPKVNAIVSSGYSNDRVMADYRGYGFQGVVTKPYKIQELSEVLQEVISS